MTLLDKYTEDVLKRIMSPTVVHREVIRKELCYVATYMENESDWPNDEGILDYRVESHISPYLSDCMVDALSVSETETNIETLTRYIIIAGVKMWSKDTSVRYDDMYDLPDHSEDMENG